MGINSLSGSKLKINEYDDGRFQSEFGWRKSTYNSDLSLNNNQFQFALTGSFNKQDTTVVASAYDTSGNGGRKLVRLTNGWLVSAVTDTTNGIVYIYKSVDNGATFQALCNINLGGFAYNSLAITSKGNFAYVSVCFGNAYIRVWVIDTTTQTNTNIYATGFAQIDSSQTALGGISLTINDTGTELHATWSSKNSSYPNTLNIRYAKGTINADGSVTWGMIEQVTSYNNSSYPNFAISPSITVKNNIPIIVFEQDGQFFNSAAVGLSGGNAITVVKKDSSLTTGLSNINSVWSVKTIFYDTSYTQSNPSAIFVPQSINGLANGRIWVVWHGRDSTDTSRDNIRYSYSDDGGVTWSAMAKLTNGNLYDQNFVTITANKNNEIFVLWGGNDATDLNQDVRMIKNSSGSWGAFSVVANGTTQHKRYPSALYDFNFNFSSPLFIYQDAQNLKVGFYGTWAGITSSTIVKNFKPADNYGLGIISWDETKPTNTSITLDILDKDNNLLKSGVINGTDLSKLSELIGYKNLNFKWTLSRNSVTDTSPSISNPIITWQGSNIFLDESTNTNYSIHLNNGALFLEEEA